MMMMLGEKLRPHRRGKGQARMILMMGERMMRDHPSGKTQSWDGTLTNSVGQYSSLSFPHFL